MPARSWRIVLIGACGYDADSPTWAVKTMKLILKIVAVVVLVSLVLVALTLTVLRFQPDWALGVLNSVQSAAKIDADGIAVSYLPPAVRAKSVAIAMAAQDIQIDSADIGLNPEAWWSDTPFWGVDIERVNIIQRDSASVPTPDEPTDSVGVLNVMPYLTFSQIRVGELSMSGATPLSAQFLAQQQGRDIVIEASGSSGSSRFAMDGTLERRGSDLAFALTINAQSAAQVEVEGAQAAEVEAKLQGALASGRRLQLEIDAGEVQVQLGEQLHQLQALSGQVTLAPKKPGDEIRFEQLAGQYLAPGWQEQLPFSTTGTVSLVADQVGIDAEAAVGESTLALALTGALEAGSWKGTVGVDSKGLHSSISTAPYQAEEVFPLSLSSAVEYADNTLQLSGLELRSPANQFAGDVLLGLGEPLKLVANIAAEQLYVPLVGDAEAEPEAAAEFATAAEPPEAADAEPASELLFSAEPIDWGWIEAAQIDLVLKAGKLLLQEAQFENLDVAVRNEAGVLTLQPFAAQLGDGGFEGQLVLALQEANADAASARPVSLQTTLDVRGIALESFGFVPQEELQGGALEVALQLGANGQSARDLASSLDGDILAMVEEATLMNDFVELAGSDLLMETLNKLNPFAKQDPTTELNCALVHFTADDGELKTDNQLVMETSKMEIVGNGSIDLNTEKLSIGFTPNAKSGVGINIGSVVKFLKVGGTLSAPRPAADAGGLLKSGLAIGAAISTGGASVVAEGLAKRALKGGSACAAARAAPAAENAQREPEPG
ncbi:MAG: AsmA family protein [Pseudomonadales bacterium]